MIKKAKDLIPEYRMVSEVLNNKGKYTMEQIKLHKQGGAAVLSFLPVW